MNGAFRVLHVVESYGAGVASAVDQYVTATPEFEHHLIRRIRVGEYTDGQENLSFASVHEIPMGHGAAIASIRKRVAAVGPSVIHAHSSVAGVYTRLAVATTRRRPIVYTPHCFAFERRDSGTVTRLAFLVAEWLLSINTQRIAACSEREAQLGNRMPARKGSIFVPNTSDFTSHGRVIRRTEVQRIATMGRVSAQKDLSFFIATVLSIRAEFPKLQATWIGGGSAENEARLRSNGIEVTGWLAHDQIIQELLEADVYMHTAAWEGFPLALLDAHGLGLPIVARKIPALSGCPSQMLAAHPAALAQLVLQLKKVGQVGLDENWLSWRDSFELNTRHVQANRLKSAYLTEENHEPGLGSTAQLSSITGKKFGE